MNPYNDELMAYEDDAEDREENQEAEGVPPRRLISSAVN